VWTRAGAPADKPPFAILLYAPCVMNLSPFRP